MIINHVDNFQQTIHPAYQFQHEIESAWPWIKPWTLHACNDTASLNILSPSSGCSDLKGVSVAFRLLVEFPRRSGREEDTDTTEGFLLHFNTDGNSSTTGNSSGAGNSSCNAQRGGKRKIY